MPLAVIYIVMFVGQILASGTFVAGKWALVDFPPLTLALFRFTISSIGLFILHRFWPGRKPIEPGDWKYILTLGALAVIFNQTVFLIGLKYTTPTHSALLYGAMPVFVYLLSIKFLGERVTILKTGGVIVTFLGVGVVLSQEGIQLQGKTWIGDLLVLVAVIAWAVYTVIGKPMVTKYGPLHTTALALITGSLMYFPFGLFTLSGFEPQAVTARGWGSLFYIAIATSIVAYTIWFWAIGKLEATKVSVFNNFQPIIAGVLSYLLMGEQIGVRLIAGGVLVIFGVVLTERG